MICVVCKVDKPEDDFYLRGDRGKVKRRSECKPCMGRKARARRLRDRYGMHEFDFFVLVKTAQAKCMLCRKPFLTIAEINVDHDHVTGKVRGVLCMPCNTGIGLLGDSIEGLERAVDYLKSPLKERQF